MRRIALTVVYLSSTLVTYVQAQSPEVMLFGVFHFANPGRDAVQTSQIDVSTPENQEYLEALAERLCAFRPTVILVEVEPEGEAILQDQLRGYLDGRVNLAIDEGHQIGFRVARACGVERIHGFDHDDVGWRGDLLFEHLEAYDPSYLEFLNDEIARLGHAETAAHRDLDLRELLIRANDPAEDRANMDFYLLTNAIGAGAGFEGADATAGWWHRNFRMYANIQNFSTEGARVLVIAGQGHTAILRDLLEIDRRISATDIRAFL